MAFESIINRNIPEHNKALHLEEQIELLKSCLDLQMQGGQRESLNITALKNESKLGTNLNTFLTSACSELDFEDSKGLISTSVSKFLMEFISSAI